MESIESLRVEIRQLREDLQEVKRDLRELRQLFHEEIYQNGLSSRVVQLETRERLIMWLLATMGGAAVAYVVSRILHLI
ncbi:MAG: hypothetical protein RML46_06630 [Anaerolineae bacterium]|nr:hypothetical protein [Anaerolineae bacterium]